MLEIVGHNGISERLRLAAVKGALAPSYLFAGPKGVGKFLTARYFCMSVFCRAGSEDRPCGECLGCRRVLSGNHPDLRILTNQEGKLSIGIDEVREGIDSVQTCSSEGGFRFWIIDEAQRMTDEAQSALLKTLEEPPPSLVLILISQGEDKLLPTVISRCRRINFKSLSAAELKAFLLRKGYEEGKADVAARISGGSAGTALNFLQDGELWDRRVALFSILDNSVPGDLWTALDSASQVDELCSGKTGRDKMLFCLDMAASLYRDALLHKIGTGGDILINADCGLLLDKLASAYEVLALEKCIEEINSCKYKLERYVNPRLAWQSLFITLQDLAS